MQKSSSRLFECLLLLIFAAIASTEITQAQVTSGSVYKLRNQCSGKVLDVSNNSQVDGALVHQWTDWNGLNQQWKIEATDSGFYKLTAQHSGKALDVKDVSTADGTNVQQWSYVGGGNQQWKLVSVGNDYYELQARHTSNKMLDVSGASTADGARVQIWTSNHTCAQRWRFELVSQAPTPPPNSAVQRSCDLSSYNSADTSNRNKVAYSYCVILGRVADNSGLDAYTAQLNQGLTTQQLLMIFLGSTEFNNRYAVSAMSNSSFVTFMYRLLFNREPDSAGLAAYVSQLDGGRSRSDLQLELTSSHEFQQKHPILSSSGNIPPPGTLPRYGIAAGHSLPWLPESERNAYLDDCKTIGAGWVRVDIDWGIIQDGGSNSYNWAPFDRVVEAANARGIRVLGTLAYTPSWARPSGSTDKHAPTDLNNYFNFARAAVRHYAPLGVHHWEIWNEPNISNFWQPTPDPVRYAAMLKGVYPVIKQEDAAAFVISGGMSPAADNGVNVAPITFLRTLYEQGAGSSMDAVGHHPYSWPVLPSYPHDQNAWHQMAGTSPSLRSVMTDYSDGNKQIWLTEFGAPTNGNDRPVTEQMQAEILTEAFNQVKTTSWMGPIFYYQYKDLGTDTSNREHFFGLIRFDGSRKPSYYAFRDFPK